jgi:hypothetical protein
MTPLKTQDVQVLGIRLGKSIYSPEQIDEFIRFQESQGTRRAFLAESAERSYNSRFGGEWGSGLTDLATDHLVDVVGFHLVPLYRLLGPTAIIAILVLFLVGIIRMLLDIVIRAIAIARVRGCGLWLLGALWGTLLQVAVSPVRWAAGVGHDAGLRVRYHMDAEVARIDSEDKVEFDHKSTLKIEARCPYAHPVAPSATWIAWWTGPTSGPAGIMHPDHTPHQALPWMKNPSRSWPRPKKPRRGAGTSNFKKDIAAESRSWDCITASGSNCHQLLAA